MPKNSSGERQLTSHLPLPLSKPHEMKWFHTKIETQHESCVPASMGLYINNNSSIATLGPSWNFSLTEILVSLSLQDGLRSGIIIGQPTSRPASHPAFRLPWKVENLSSHSSDLTQTLKLSLGDETKIYKCLQLKTAFNRRRPSTEDNLKISKAEYFCNHLKDLTQI